MPDAAALRQGRLQISFCSAAGSPPSVMTALMDGARAIPGHVRHVRDVRSTRRRTRQPGRRRPGMPVLDGGAPDPGPAAAAYLPALPAAAVASVAPRRRCPLAAAARGRPAWGRAPRLSRPWPDRTIRARRAFSGVASACLSPPCAAFPVHDPRAARRHARGSDMQRQRRTVMQNPSFNFPAPWRWPRPWPPSFRRPRPAGARPARHGSGGHHRRRADSPLTFITNPKTPPPAAAGPATAPTT